MKKQQYEIDHMIQIDREIEYQTERDEAVGDPQFIPAEHPNERAEQHHDDRRQHAFDKEPCRYIADG